MSLHTMNKDELLKIVHEKLSEKVVALEALIADTRAANNETKSSMGDKYETSREMVQQEINKLQLQLNANLAARASLATLPLSRHDTVGAGSLVKTERGLFLIAVSVGEIIFCDEKVFVISPESPLASVLTGKTAGDTISVNNMKHNILQVW